MASLYAAIRKIVDTKSKGAKGSLMQEGKVQSVRGDGMVVVTVQGKTAIAAPINDGHLTPGASAWVSSATGGPSIVHGEKF